MTTPQVRTDEFEHAFREAVHALGLDAPWRDCTSPYRLARRLERAERRHRGNHFPIFILAIGTTRRCGGPEEGGWWYDDTEVLVVWVAATLRGACAAAGV